MVYTGYRHVLPGQNYLDWKDADGNVGVYSNNFILSPVQLLQDVGDPALTGHPQYAINDYLIQMFKGEFSYNTHHYSDQSAPYLTHRNLEFHGVPSAEMFPQGGDWGHDGTREISTSRWSNLIFRGVPSADSTLDGHVRREYNTVVAFQGPTDPYLNKGVTGDALDTTEAETLESKYATSHAFFRSTVHQGVPSAKAL